MDNKEYNVEDDMGTGHIGYHGIGGKDNRHGSSEPHPRHEHFRPHGDFAHGRQA